MKYISAMEAADRWNLSRRRIITLCNNGRIEGAQKAGATWDNLPLPSFTLDDVDDGVVKHFKKWAAKKGRIEKSALDETKEP